MKDKVINYSRRKLIACIIITVLIFSYAILVIYNFTTVLKYNDYVLPNSYLEDYSIGDYSYESLDEFITFLNGVVNDKRLVFNINNKEVGYKYSDIGLSLDNKKIIDNIKSNQKKLSYSSKLKSINDKKKINYNYIFSYNDEDVKNFVNKLKQENDTVRVDGHFVDDGGIRYENGTDSFSINVDSTYDALIKQLDIGINSDTKITLLGELDKAVNNESYATIDTMTSSFVTDFMPNTYLRNINLNTALGYINGTVVNPGEIFSYCEKAGPFNKAGYVFYYEFVGNGVCQIATTTYNAALLGGLEIVKRYPHAKKSLYVAGGLDATVASYSSGWCADMQFKNTYEYPIYIKAYSEGGRAHVEFWSNSNAKGGYEYATESVRIGQRGYNSFLHVYKDGVEVEKRFIATTWYTEE